jgi:hypothetical protein
MLFAARVAAHKKLLGELTANAAVIAGGQFRTSASRKHNKGPASAGPCWFSWRAVR